MKVKCPHCNYEWETKSELIMTTCPSCQRKIRIRETEKTTLKDKQNK